jgi:hypothetical protein
MFSFVFFAFRCRCGLVQQYQQMLADLLEAADCPTTGTIAVDSLKIQQALEGDSFPDRSFLNLRFFFLNERDFSHGLYNWFITCRHSQGRKFGS